MSAGHRKASYASWANTVDRTARLRNARAAGPAGIEYHLARLPEKFANATEALRREAAEAARQAFYINLSMKAAAARKRGAA